MESSATAGFAYGILKAVHKRYLPQEYKEVAYRAIQESSATAGFAYGILKAVHKRYLPQEYKEVAYRAIQGLLEQIDEKGEVQHVSIGTGMGDSLDFYRNIGITAMPYGQSLTVLCLRDRNGG